MYTTPRRNAKPRGYGTPRSAYRTPKSYRGKRKMRSSYGGSRSLGRLIGAGRNYARHTFVRSSYHTNYITCHGAAGTTLWDFSLAFALSQITANSSVSGTVTSTVPFNNISDLTALFEEFRIRKVKVTLIPNWDTHAPTAGATGTMINDPANMVPSIYYVVDHDDNATVPMLSLMQMQGVKMHFDRKPLQYTFTPKPMLLAATSSSLAVGARPGSSSTWLDIDNNTTPYNALKFTIRTGDLGGLNALNWDLKVDYVIECKGVR